MYQLKNARELRPSQMASQTLPNSYNLVWSETIVAQLNQAVLVIHPIFLGVILNCNLNLILRNDDDALHHIVVFDGVMDAGNC
jgi:hypothetical protein